MLSQMFRIVMVPPSLEMITIRVYIFLKTKEKFGKQYYYDLSTCFSPNGSVWQVGPYAELVVIKTLLCNVIAHDLIKLENMSYIEKGICDLIKQEIFNRWTGGLGNLKHISSGNYLIFERLDEWIRQSFDGFKILWLRDAQFDICASGTDSRFRSWSSFLSNLKAKFNSWRYKFTAKDKLELIWGWTDEDAVSNLLL